MESYNNIEEDLRYINWQIKIKGREILKDFKITIPQLTALCYIINTEGIKIGELSMSMNLSSSTVTELVDRMERNQLVIRKRDQDDKRIYRIYVKEKGKIIREEVIKRRVKYVSELFNKTNIDTFNFSNDLAKLRKAIEN